MSHDFYARLLRHFSRKSRHQKFELFATVLKPRPEDRILDIGASGRVFTAYTFEDFYPYPERIVGVGVDLEEVRSAKLTHPLSRYAVLDGCRLPFSDQSFDIVFSNAVIEHILGEGRQEQFAREVMRVGKSWFVTTPNYWFLFESHYHLPFIHFLPQPLQRTYNRLFGTHIAKGAVQDLALLSARGLRKLFPAGSIAKVRITFWPETLVAYYVDPNRDLPGHFRKG
jgi:SAM-dependent methyltransferase